MDRTKQYILDLTQPPTEPVTFVYDLDHYYWTELAGDEILDGDVRAEVRVEPLRGVYKLVLDFKGGVEVTCDRCLAPLSYSVDTEEEVTLELGEETDDSDDTIIVDRNKPLYNLAWLMYELIALSLPMKRMHAPEDCDPEMMAYLEKATTNAEASVADPRWQELRHKYEEGNNNN